MIVDQPDPSEIVEFTGKRREPVEGNPFLVPVPYSACRHQFTTFVVDVDGGKCTCKACGGEVTPMFVLEKLMQQESRWMRTRAAYQDEMKRLSERSRTKCRKCGAMTPVSHS